MNGLLASLRSAFALRGPMLATASGPAATRIRPDGAVALRTAGPRLPLTRSGSGRRTFGTPQTAPVGRPVPALEPVAEPVADPIPAAPAAQLPAPSIAALVEPSVRVAAAHLVDPVGLRVVPFRPTTRWPLRRAAPRIYDPFRGFPQRSAHLADLMDGGTRER